MIEAALIKLPSRADEPIFGRPLLERLIILCRRAGIPKVIIEVGPNERDRAISGLGAFSRDPAIEIVQSLRDAGAAEDFNPADVFIQFSGNLVRA